jgi:hypothetical protein
LISIPKPLGLPLKIFFKPLNIRFYTPKWQ